MYHKILVPLDGSKRAEAILPHVKQLASLYKAEVLLLQVFALPHLTDLSKTETKAFDALEKQTVQEMETHVKEAESYLQQISDQLSEFATHTETRVVYGPIASTILKTAEIENADLIAMASHGCSGLQGVYYGSVAEGVLHRVDRPLLIVRSDPDDPSNGC